MSLTITPEILGQVADQNCSYCFLYEPLRVSVLESDEDGEKIYIDLEIYRTNNDDPDTYLVNTEVEYAVFDINPGNPVSVDLMKLARQYHDANVYKYASIEDVVDLEEGWKSVVSEYKYKFLIYSDETDTKSEVFKLPIIGGRLFSDFTPAVDETQALSEMELNNVSLDGRWIGYPVISQSLKNPNIADSRPTITSSIQTSGCTSEGYLIWKSRLGGWVTWGFDITTESNSGSYTGKLESKYFETTDKSGGGDPYVPVNYAGMESKYSYNMKSLSLLTSELRGVSGVHYTPAIYFMKDGSSMELMRKTGATTPISSIANGGDFSVSLGNISSMTHKTR